MGEIDEQVAWQVLAQEIAPLHGLGEIDIMTMIEQDLQRPWHGVYPIKAILSAMREYARRLRAVGVTVGEPALTGLEVEGWQPIETAPKGRKLIAGYWNELGNWRTITARYYLPKTLDWNSDYDGGYEDGFAPEGWYEESETQDAIMPCTMPTHWQPLPAPPKRSEPASVSGSPPSPKQTSELEEAGNEALGNSLK